MNRILLIAGLLIALVFTASADRRRLLMSRNAATAASGITADLWQTFEFTDPTVANLAANDNTSTGTWTTNDVAGILVTTSTSAERALLTTVNGSSDGSHTTGLSRNYASTGAAYPQFDIGAGNTKASVSAGCWFKYSGNPGINKRIFVLYGTSADLMRIDFQYSTDTVIINGAANSNAVALVEGSWYWVTAQFNQNATSYMRVYDSTGAQVGNETSITAPNQAFRYFMISSYNAETSDSGITFYWDDFVLDWTDATFPLGPN